MPDTADCEPLVVVLANGGTEAPLEAMAVGAEAVMKGSPVPERAPSVPEAVPTAVEPPVPLNPDGVTPIVPVTVNVGKIDAEL